MTTAQSAAPAAPKQRQKCMRQRKRYTHVAPPPPTRPRSVSGLPSAFALIGGGCPTIWQPSGRAAAVPTRVVDPPRDTYPPRRPPREESKDDDVVPRNPIEARLLARERERKAKKPLTAKDLDNKMAEAEERRQLELEAIKFKGAQFSRPAPGPRRTVDYGEEKDSHK